MFILLALAVLFWFWIGFKTWAFVATDLADKSGGKTTVIYSFFGGLCWPATYAGLDLRSHDIDDASRKVIEFCKEELADLDASSDEDVNIDLGFILLDREVMEI